MRVPAMTAATPSPASLNSPGEGRRVLRRASRLIAFAIFLVWEAPQSVLGLLFLACVAAGRRVASAKWVGARLLVEMRIRIGVSLGLFVFWFPGRAGEMRPGTPTVLRHELGHAFQSRMLGPLFLPAIGLPSILRAGYGLWRNRPGRPPWLGYFDGYPERWANRVATRRLEAERRRP